MTITLDTISIKRGHEQVVYETHTALTGAAVFNTPNYGAAAAAWVQRGDADIVTVTALANQASAALGAVVEESDDDAVDASKAVHKTNQLVDSAGATTIGASTDVAMQVQITHKYWRFRWTNGAVAQTLFDCLVTAKQER